MKLVHEAVRFNEVSCCVCSSNFGLRLRLQRRRAARTLFPPEKAERAVRNFGNVSAASYLLRLQLELCLPPEKAEHAVRSHDDTEAVASQTCCGRGYGGP